jgi:hypothetical protein
MMGRPVSYTNQVILRCVGKLHDFRKLGLILFSLVIHAIVSLGGHWTSQHRPPSESTTATTAAIRLSAAAETAGPEETAHPAISHAAPAATNYTSTTADVATATAADSHPATGPAAASKREPEPAAAAAVSYASTTAVVAAEAFRRGPSAATANDSGVGKLETFTNGGKLTPFISVVGPGSGAF